MDLDKTKVVSILGDMNSGKTNLAFHLLREYKGERKIYLLGYPKQVDDFTMISDFNDIFALTDSIIFIDEIHRFIKLYDKRANQDLLELISFLSHNNNTLIFSTQLSQFVTKSVEAFVDGWCITKLKDIKSLKNGSKPKRIIQNTVHHLCTKWSLVLVPGQYLENCEAGAVGENGVKTFPFQGIGKDWKNTEIFADKIIVEKATKKNVSVTLQTQNKLEKEIEKEID